MKRIHQSTGAVVGLFMLSLAAFLYLNTRPNNHDCPNRSYLSPASVDSIRIPKKDLLKQAISNNPAIQALHFIEETNELIGFHK